MNKKKIIVLGLDNVGKTSILELITHKMVNFLTIAPTKGIERREAEILGHSIAIQDMGGQKIYRESHLKHPRDFDASDVLVYVVDLQDTGRYELAMEYFQQIMELIKHDSSPEHAKPPKLFVLFHKFDKEYMQKYNDDSSIVREQFNTIKNRFTTIATRFGLEIYETYRTSVFDEWSVFTAFYDIWSAIITRLGSIQEYLQKIVKDVPGVIVALLLDVKGNIIAKHMGSGDQAPVADETVLDYAKRCISMLDQVQKTVFQNDPNADKVSMKMDSKQIFIHRIDCDTGTYYLTVLKENSTSDDVRDAIKKLAYSMLVFLSKPT